nr:MAG TPA_asm: hypothetical protein [Caudoviricetes sp.]
MLVLNRLYTKVQVTSSSVSFPYLYNPIRFNTNLITNRLICFIDYIDLRLPCIICSSYIEDLLKRLPTTMPYIYKRFTSSLEYRIIVYT